MADYSLTLSAQIAEEIIELISQNEIQPRSRLIERSLMERFGVSQTVIREARLLLDAKGVVTTHPRKGTYVNDPTRDELAMMFEVRKMLDVFASKQAALHHDAQDIAELRALSSAAEDAYQNGAFGQFFRLSRQFHKRIYECAGFLCLLRIYDNLTTLTDLFHYYAHVSKDVDLVDDVLGHRQICDAIEAGDPALCEKVVSGHIEKTCSRDMMIIHAETPRKEPD